MELCLQDAQTVFKWLMMLLCGKAQTLAYLGSVSGVYEISLAAENKHQVSFYITVPLNQFIREPQSLPYKAEKGIQALGSPPTHLAAPVVHCETSVYRASHVRKLFRIRNFPGVPVLLSHHMAHL